MHRRRAALRACVLVLCACGDGGDDGVVDEQVVDELAGFCTATFTADHDLVDHFGDVALHVTAGDSFLLTGLGGSFSPELVVRSNTGTATLDLGDAPVDAPCLGDGATLTSELAAFTDVEVYADGTFGQIVCMIDQFAHSPSNGYGAGAVDGGYQIFLGGAFCDGVDEGYVRQATAVLGGTTYISAPFVQLFRLDG